MTIKITKWETKKKVVDNSSHRPEIPYVQSVILMATLNTACRWSKRSTKKNSFYFQGFYFLGDTQVMGYGILKKKVQGNYTLNNKQTLPCRRWCRGPLLFLHKFMCLVLLLLLHNSGKLAIPHGHLLLLLNLGNT